MRPINADDVLSIIDDLRDQMMVEGYWSVVERVKALPSAQPEIIRCKDCKWCKDADGLMCKNPASWVVATECDFGCVLAERRTDERSD